MRAYTLTDKGMSPGMYVEKNKEIYIGHSGPIGSVETIGLNQGLIEKVELVGLQQQQGPFYPKLQIGPQQQRSDDSLILADFSETPSDKGEPQFSIPENAKELSTGWGVHLILLPLGEKLKISGALMIIGGKSRICDLIITATRDLPSLKILERY